MSDVPSNLIPTRITGLPEYLGTSTLGYLPYVIDGNTYKVQFANIAAVGAVPSTREINTGSGLGGGGDLSANRTLFILPGGVDDSRLTTTGVTAGTYGAADSVPVLTINAQGRVTAATLAPIVLSNYVPTSRTITAGAGLTGGGDLSANRTFAVNFSSTTPEPLGPGSSGVSTVAAREDHVHPAVDLSDTTETQGVLPLSRGGTGNSLSPVVGAVAYSSNDALYLTPTSGNAGDVLVSGGGVSPPFWQAPIGGGTVTSVAASGGTTGLTFTGSPITTSGTLTLGGTLAVANGGTGATNAATALTNLGAYPASNPAGYTSNVGTVTSVSGTGTVSGLSLSGTVTSAGSLTLGGTLAVTPSNFASQSANTFLAAPNGSAGVPTFRAIVAADVPTLNQNTTGTAGNVSGIVAVANGGTGASVAGTARTNLGAAASGANTDITSIALTTGTISATPTNGTDIVNKTYADSIASGINFHQSVRLATAAALPANTYNNGSSGVGATLTANANGALSVDSVAVVVGNRILVKNEVAQANNGVYTVTQVGSAGTPYILTRATDFDSAGTGVDQIDAGDFFLVTAGSTQSNTSWVQQTPLPITVGTTALVFTQFAAPVLYSAGTGLTLAGTVFSITNTGVSASTYGSASSVPVLAINAQGQVTSASSSSIAIAASQITSGTVTVAQGGTGATTLTSNGVLLGNGTSAISATAVGATGQVLVGNTGGAPSWATLTGIGVTSFSAGTTGLTPNSATTGAITLAGTLNVANGGTGATTLSSGYLVKGNGTSAVSASVVYDDGTNVGIGTSSPLSRLTVSGGYFSQTNGTITTFLGADGTGSLFGTSTNHYLRFITNDTERMRIDSSGNVGIGTTSPSSKLTVASSNVTVNAGYGIAFTGDQNRIITPDDGVFGALIKWGATGGCRFFESTTERMRIDNAGNVGIGTTSSGARLQVSGGVSVQGQSVPTSGAGLELLWDGTQSVVQSYNRGTAAYQPLWLEAGSYLRFAIGGTERMRIDASGNVGIGTSSPGQRLDVNGTIQVRTSGFEFGRILTNNVSASTGGLTLQYNAGGTFTDGVVLNGSGNVGIGTATPSAKLTVYNAGSGDAAVRIGNAQNANTTDVGKQGVTGYGATSAGDGFLYSPSNLSIMSDGGVIKFSSGGNAERMRIDASGNVGIGTTPSPWGGAFKGFQVSTGAALMGNSNAAWLTGNTYYNGSNWIRTTASSVTVLDLAADGTFNFYNAGTGAAGSVAALSQSMKIDASGNVGIGTSSPSSIGGYKALTLNAASGTFTDYMENGTIRLRIGGDLGAAFINGASGTLRFLTSDLDRMRIDSSGNASIGTTTGAARLRVAAAGAVNAPVLGNVTNYPAFFSNSDAGYGLGVGTSAGDGHVWLQAQRTDGTATAYNITLNEAGGNVGIGTASPGAVLQLNKASGAADLRLSVGGTLYSNIYASSSDVNILSITAIPLIFGTNNTERARIDSSGNLLVGTTVMPNSSTAGMGYNRASTFLSLSCGATTTSVVQVYFTNGNGTVGSIATNGTATAYNTSSDYRLKDIDGPIANSGAYIDALKPVQGSWKADGSRFIGLLAHEVQEVSETPIATGEKDGEEMQAMDYSAPELIANLIAEIQSLRARVAQLEGN